MTEPAGPSDAVGGTSTDTPQRLHPMSWLFVLLSQLRQYLIPLIALFVLGRKDSPGRAPPSLERWDSELWPLLGVAVLAASSVWRSFTYGYGIGQDALRIRSGVLSRSLRIIPFARIHNVAIEQTLLHRLFGVASVRLESAGSERPEAEMRVLSMDAAIALEALVRRHTTAGRPSAVTDAQARSTSGPTAPAVGGPVTLLRLPLREVVLQGLLSNRGLIALGAVFAALAQPGLNFDWGLPWRLTERLLRRTIGEDQGALSRAEPLLLAIYGALVLVGALVVLRLLSVALTLLQDYGFTLTREGRRITVERGLISRVRSSISRRRIQSWTLREPLLHRLAHRRTLAIDNAAGAGEEGSGHTLRELAPLVTPAQADRLIQDLAPATGWPAVGWQRLPGSHWWRRAAPAAAVLLLLSLGLGRLFGATGLLPLLFLPLVAWSARREAELARWAVTDSLVAVKEGWLERTWRFAELDKLQAVELSRSPIDRACGTATLWLDTAGASGMGPPLRIAYLPAAEAQRLADILTDALAHRPLRW